jgi:hypothetical protein
MKFIAPRTGAPERTIAENQPQYQPITVAMYRNSDYPEATEFLTRLTITKEERAQIAAGEDIFIAELCFGPRFTPLMVQVGMQHWKVDPIEESADGSRTT